MQAGRRTALRRMYVVAGLFALVWAWTILISGGFVIHVGPLRISSRNPRNPLLLTMAAFLATWVLGRREAGWRWAADWEWLTSAATQIAPPPVRRRATPSVLAIALAVATAVIGITRGADVAGGSDSYGYVSQSRLWTTGQLKVPQPLLDDLPAGVPQEALVPLGYGLSPDRTMLVPSYAPGMPLLMSLFERLGGSKAVFVVMPLLAGAAVWMTYALGSMLMGPAAGLVAAGLLATSPAFVLQLLNPPMSDIAAAAWWTTALYFALRPDRRAAAAAGLATFAAILTRPNLVPLAAVVGVLFLIEVFRRDADRHRAVHRLLLFGLPSAAACGVIARLNQYWYGSPLASGYGTLAGALFRWEHFWPNMANYSRWTLDTLGPLSLLSVAGLFALHRMARSRRQTTAFVACISLAVVAYLSYAFYLPFDTWPYLRFLFPALPMFVFLMVAGGFAVADRLSTDWRWAGRVAFLMALTAHTAAFGRSHGVFNPEPELRFELAGTYVRDHLPANAAIFAMLHSGSARHYSGRLTVRYDWIPADRFDETIVHLRDRGYAPFLLIDDAERDAFAERFRGAIPGYRPDRPLMRVQGVNLYAVTDVRAR